MHEFEKLVYRRDVTINDVGPWYWLRSDSGAWDGPKNDWESSHQYHWFEHVTDRTVCFQAGACLGMYPRLLAEEFETVYSCEPDRLNFYVASLNCQVDNVFLLNAAVGKESGNFIGVKRNHMENVGMHKTIGRGPVPIVSIDSLRIPVLGLLALDIEGYEYEAIQGAVETIRRCSPVVILERPAEHTRTFMTDLGYDEYCRSVSDSVFIKK